MKAVKNVWKKWKRLAQIAANVEAQVVFTLFYFLILWTVGFIFRLVSDPLNIKDKSIKSSFTSWSHPKEDIIQAGKPF